jgi:hypothetical protein
VKHVSFHEYLHGAESFLGNRQWFNESQFSNVLCNLKYHCSIHNRLPLIPTVNQMNPVHITSSYRSKIHHLRRCLPSGPFHSCFPSRILYALPFASMRATCLAHFILLYLIILITFRKGYKIVLIIFGVEWNQKNNVSGE